MHYLTFYRIYCMCLKTEDLEPNSFRDLDRIGKFSSPWWLWDQRSWVAWPNLFPTRSFAKYFWFSEAAISLIFLGNEKCARTFFAQTFWAPPGVRDIPAKFRDIPDSSLRNPRKTKFRGRARSFRPPPLPVEDPPSTGRSPDPKSQSLCSFFPFLIFWVSEFWISETRAMKRPKRKRLGPPNSWDLPLHPHNCETKPCLDIFTGTPNQSHQQRQSKLQTALVWSKANYKLLWWRKANYKLLW